jgi:hypothetical protein
MFDFIRARAILSRLFRRLSPSEPPTTFPDDPDVGVREPRRGRRPGGGSAIAVAEPDEDLATEAYSRTRR